jgi:hypothetical protein
MSRDSKDTDQYSELETIVRRDAALKRLLSTPHKPQKPIGKKRKKRVKRTHGSS